MSDRMTETRGAECVEYEMNFALWIYVFCASVLYRTVGRTRDSS